MNSSEVELTAEQKKMALLTEWNLVLQEAMRCKPIVEKEQALRKEVMAAFFPEPTEGVRVWTLINPPQVQPISGAVRATPRTMLIQPQINHPMKADTITDQNSPAHAHPSIRPHRQTSF